MLHEGFGLVGVLDAGGIRGESLPVQRKYRFDQLLERLDERHFFVPARPGAAA
jgi:hypothetical protein